MYIIYVQESSVMYFTHIEIVIIVSISLLLENKSMSYLLLYILSLY